MKETSGLEADAVLTSQPYLKNIGMRKTVETVNKSEDIEKKKKKPKRRTVADMNDMYERYFLEEVPGERMHKEEETQGEFSHIGPDIEADLREFGNSLKATPQEIQYLLSLMADEDFDTQVTSYGTGQGRTKFAKLLGMLRSGELQEETPEAQTEYAPQEMSTQQIRRSMGNFEDDIELANTVTKAMHEVTNQKFNQDNTLADTVTDIMKSTQSPQFTWTQQVDPEMGAVEEYHAPFENNVLKARIHFYERTTKNQDHYAVQFEHGGVIFAKNFPTLTESRNYLKDQREYDIKKYFGLRETEKPYPALQVLLNAYQKQYEAATDENRKKVLEGKLKNIRQRLGITDKPLKDSESDKKVEKTFVDDVSPASWEDINRIVKMATYKTNYIKLLEHGIYDKDRNLVDLESLNENGEYYTREGEKIPSDDIKAVYQILETGIYSVTRLQSTPRAGSRLSAIT